MAIKESDNQSETDFIPSKEQVKMLEAFIKSPINYTIARICKNADVSRTTFWRWRQSPEFNKWFNKEIERIMIGSLTEVWRGVFRRAKGNFQDAKLFMQRFDEDFTEKKELSHLLKELPDIHFVPSKEKDDKGS